jgi:hypothetical protein
MAARCNWASTAWPDPALGLPNCPTTPYRQTNTLKKGGELTFAVAFQVLLAVLFSPPPLALDAPPLPGGRSVNFVFETYAVRGCPWAKSTEIGRAARNPVNHMLLTSLLTPRLLSSVPTRLSISRRC